MRTAWKLAFSIAASVALTTSTALGAPPDTVVRLKNGDLARGTLVELVGGDHVTIILPTGETRLYKWDDVDTVKNEPTAAPPPPPPVATQAPAPPPPPSGAVVHIETNDEDARLSRLASTGEGILSVGGGGYGTVTVDVYDAVCHAPCDRLVPAGWYNMAGEGLIPSRQFEVPARGAITVNAHMASRGRVIGGRWGLIVGIPFTIAGGFILAFAATSSVFDPEPKSGLGGFDRTPYLAMGAGVLGLGLLGVGLGIYFLATAHSDVTTGTTGTTSPSNSLASFVHRGFALSF